MVEPLVRAALLEDLGGAGDLTTDAVAGGAAMRVAIVARRPGRLAALGAALLAFELLDPDVQIERRAADGSRVEGGTAVAYISGSARAILSAERTALNLLARTSGVATATAALVELVAGTPARIVCTRKTTPGLRLLEKYAVRCGGGSNHRFGLDDAVLIKDNHIALAGSVRAAVASVRSHVGHLVKVEIEADTLDQVREALALPVDAILFDNMSTGQLREAVALAAGRVITEASGSVTAATIRAIAETGVDLISTGWITHSAPALDFGLDAM